MIAFDLQCAYGHVFEGWFEDNQAYEAQKEKDLIACPICNDTQISKVPSTFAIKTSRPTPPKAPAVDLAAIGRKIVDYVEKNFDDVGPDFAKEALKMHYGASEPRNIRGVSTQEEENLLKEEGIDFVKVPIPEPSDSDS